MLKFLLSFFIFCHCAIASNYQKPFRIVKDALQIASQQDVNNFGRVFSRVITHNHDDFQQTSPFNHHKHMHYHGSPFWPTSDISVKKTIFLGSNNSQLLEFHQELNRRFNSPQFQGKKNPLLVFPEDVEHHDRISYEERSSFLPGFHNSFVNGHQRSFYEHELAFPLCAISFFDEADVKKRPKGKPQRWYTPLEQALLMSSKKQYINEFAILDGDKQNGFWGNYSNFAIALIPKGTTIYGHFGLVAHQRNSKCGTLKRGGAGQFYIAGAKAAKKIDLITLEDALDVTSGEINFVESLAKIGLINGSQSNSERIIFDTLRAGFKEYYEIYEKHG